MPAEHRTPPPAAGPAARRLAVTVFTKTDAIGPSSRYRFHQFEPWLARAGLDVAWRPLFGPTYFAILRAPFAPLRALLKCLYVPLRFVVRMLQWSASARADLVVVEHQLFPYLPAWAERGRGRPWLLEFDDAIYLTAFHRAKMQELCRHATRVVVGNRHLAAFAQAHNPRVSVVPTVIDLSRYPPPLPLSGLAGPAAGGARPVIGWIGLPYNFPLLERLGPALAALAREQPFVLRVVSAGTPRLPGVPLECVEWRLETEVEELARCDVGIMPLADDEWSRGKCGLKVLQYFAAGLPVVASPVGVNAEIVRPGENGFLARDDAEWRDALRRLLADATLRRRLGAAGRRTVEQDFALDDWGPRVAALWRAAAEEAAA